MIVMLCPRCDKEYQLADSLRGLADKAKAVVTQKARITEGETTVPVFQTLIYGRTIEGLKVQHSQTSMLTHNGRGNDTNSAVRVVQEVIGPAVSVVGVAQ